MVVLPTGSDIGFTDNDYNASLPYATQKVFNSWFDDKKNMTITKYMSTAKIAGVTRQKVANDPGFSGIMQVGGGGQAPTNLLAWRVFLQNADRSSITTSTTINIFITYYCKLYGRRQPIWSSAGHTDTNYLDNNWIDGDTGGTGPYGPTGAGFTQATVI